MPRSAVVFDALTLEVAMFTRAVVLASLGAALLPGCYASGGSPDALVADAPSASLVDAPLFGTVSLSRSEPSTEVCPEWEIPAHPSPEVPAGTPTGAQPLWEWTNPADDGVIGNLGLAPDGSVRVHVAGSTFVRINRDGSEAWTRDLGGEVPIWGIAPDGSIFAAPFESGDLGHRLIHLAPDGTRVGTYELDASEPGINSITFGAHGRVYVSTSRLVALCRTQHVAWVMNALHAIGGVAGFGAGVVDSEGTLITPVTGTTRAARISEDGVLLGWLGADRPIGSRPYRTSSTITSVFGSSAIIYALVDGVEIEEATIAIAGEPPVTRLRARHFDGLGRVISMDGVTDSGWLWEQRDGTVVYTETLCHHFNPVFLDDGGVLCGVNVSPSWVLRRVSPEGRVLWEYDFPDGTGSVPGTLDVDGRVTYVTSDGVTSRVRAVQTNARPLRGHWGGGHSFNTRYTR